MQKLYKNEAWRKVNRIGEALYNAMGQKPGFDIEKIVEKLGGRVVFASSDHFDAGIDAKIEIMDDRSDTEFQITCRKEPDEEYRRFCIAHEIGHLFLHMMGKDDKGEVRIIKNEFYRNNTYLDFCEWEAEEFAASFLMPEQEFRIQVENKKGDVDKIAKLFRVSSQSVIMRCKRLGMID